MRFLTEYFKHYFIGLSVVFFQTLKSNTARKLFSNQRTLHCFAMSTISTLPFSYVVQVKPLPATQTEERLRERKGR